MGMEVRGGNDLANLATLLGFDFGVAKAALSSSPLSILLRSAARKAAKGVLRVTDLTPDTSSTTPAKKGARTTDELPEFIPIPDDSPQPQKAEGKRKGKRKAVE